MQLFFLVNFIKVIKMHVCIPLLLSKLCSCCFLVNFIKVIKMHVCIPLLLSECLVTRGCNECLVTRGCKHVHFNDFYKINQKTTTA